MDKCVYCMRLELLMNQQIKAGFDLYHVCICITELSEDWTSVREPVVEGVPFYVKYLGSSLVQKASGEEATSQAIKTIIAMVSQPINCQNLKNQL